MTIWYEHTGSGRAVLFLHAAIGDSRMWEPQWHELAGSYRLIRCDLRGFGQSPSSPDPHSQARDVVEVLDAVGADSVVAVGASMGGRVALELAVGNPERIDGVVLAGSALTGHEWSVAVTDCWEAEEAALARNDLDAAVELNLAFWLDGPQRDRADLAPPRRRLVAEMQRLALERQLVAEREQHPPPERMLDLHERLGEIDVPTLVTVGADDAEDILRIASRIADGVPGARLHVLDDTAHLPSFERPGEFGRLLRTFLDAVDM